mgnify:CR=1 FL=1
MQLDHETIARIVAMHLPERRVIGVEDRGEWVRRIYRVTLDDGSAVALKVRVHMDWLDTTLHDRRVVELLAEHGLRMPRVLADDASERIIPAGYVIQEWVGGERLDGLLPRIEEDEALAVYRAVGALYRRMHAIRGPRSGVWFEDPEVTLPVSPNDYMCQSEIVEGCGKRAVDEGRLSRRTHERAIALWHEYMDELKDHRPSLIHYSAFPWTIYLERGDGAWRIAKLTGLGDTLWWDPAVDLAMLRYPPFMEVTPARWEAFLEGYGSTPESRRLHLYAVLGRLCAAMGAYMAPEGPSNDAWAARALQDVDRFLDVVERG